MTFVVTLTLTFSISSLTRAVSSECHRRLVQQRPTSPRTVSAEDRRRRISHLYGQLPANVISPLRPATYQCRLTFTASYLPMSSHLYGQLPTNVVSPLRPATCRCHLTFTARYRPMSFHLYGQLPADHRRLRARRGAHPAGRDILRRRSL